ncbi:membrane protein [Mycobacterium numidiamassiliense]|uniref:Membrane protein n=1 Tax=Mycobacterium numidiamassiliense TaxID=1841861 RepID=A0A2U3P9E7_9MYCO|nr:TIGR04255 family protein [Mycobacterium numidiamassiliense]SPM40362.1 membrane protein [Mycobacterium numidiamassiliense]
MLREVSVDAAGPTTPIALVTMEIRHPATDSLNEASSRELKNLLADHLPIERQGQDVAWGMGPGGSPAPATERFVRYVNRDNTLAASIKSQAVVVETTAYSTFEALLDVVMRVVDARSQLSSIVGVERIGLRYVVEVRVPTGADGRIDWSNQIAEPLLGPHRNAPGGLTLTEWQGAAVYREPQPGKSMIVRYGPGLGQSVDPNYHLRRTLPAEPGPFFLLDIDSFWTPTASIPEYNFDAVRATFQNLYAPARAVFDEMLIGQPRDDLLRS